jgi:transcription elongation factor Elf1
MSHITKTIYCKKCGQACTIKIQVDHQETNSNFYNRFGRIVMTRQLESEHQNENPENGEDGYFCQHCGVWNDYDDYE